MVRAKGISVALLAAAAFLLSAAPAMGAADISLSLTATPTALAFGGPETTAVTLAVTNAGPDPAASVSGTATIGAPQLTFSGFTGISQGSAVFNATSSPPMNFNFGTIAAGATATLNWVENDAQTGVGTLTATASTTTPESSAGNNTGSASVEVLGLVPSATSLAFGSHLVGGIGPATPVTLTNKAAVPVQIAGAQLSAGDFVVSADGCAGTILAPGASCETALRFAPSAAGDRTGSLTIPSSTAGVSPVTIALTGTGTVLPPDPPATLQLGVPKSINAKAFKKGFTVKVTPSEAVALDVELSGKARSGALASALDLRLFARSLPLAAGTRSVKVKPKAKLVGRIARKIKVQLQVTATDAAGNRSTVIRKLTVKPAAPKGR